mgnify:CR=1 FL=1
MTNNRRRPGRRWGVRTVRCSHRPDALFWNSWPAKAGNCPGPWERPKELPVSRPAVSQHLRALRDARLVTFRTEGTRHVYAVDQRGLGELRDWLDTFWDDALDRFKEAAEREGIFR